MGQRMAKADILRRKKFNLDGPDGLHYHWHDLRTAPEILSKRYGGSQPVMMWAAFTGNQKLPIQILQGKINSEKYQKNLEDQIKLILRQKPRKFIFQHDNAPCHASQSTKQ